MLKRSRAKIGEVTEMILNPAVRVCVRAYLVIFYAITSIDVKGPHKLIYIYIYIFRFDRYASTSVSLSTNEKNTFHFRIV